MQWIVILRDGEMVVGNWQINNEPTALDAMASAMERFTKEYRNLADAGKVSLTAERVKH